MIYIFGGAFIGLMVLWIVALLRSAANADRHMATGFADYDDTENGTGSYRRPTW